MYLDSNTSYKVNYGFWCMVINTAIAGDITGILN